MGRHKEKSLVQMAEEGDEQARHMVNAIGICASVFCLFCVGILIYLAVWSIIFTVNGGNWVTGGY